MNSRAAELAIASLLVAAVAAGALGYRAIAQASDRRQRAILLTGGDPARAPAYLRQYGCAGCHTISGVPGANGQVGPPLRSLAARVYVGGQPNTAANLVAWIINPRAINQKTPMPMTGISQQAARDVAAYLYAQ
jgi:cytochrome c1